MSRASDGFVSASLVCSFALKISRGENTVEVRSNLDLFGASCFCDYDKGSYIIMAENEIFELNLNWFAPLE